MTGWRGRSGTRREKGGKGGERRVVGVGDRWGEMGTNLEHVSFGFIGCHEFSKDWEFVQPEEKGRR